MRARGAASTARARTAPSRVARATATRTAAAPELEYLARARAPSEAFTERARGDATLAEACLRAMRVQWTHGYASVPSGFARCTHGFGEIPAGMQPAACDLIMRECFEARRRARRFRPVRGRGDDAGVRADARVARGRRGRVAVGVLRERAQKLARERGRRRRDARDGAARDGSRGEDG